MSLSDGGDAYSDSVSEGPLMGEDNGDDAEVFRGTGERFDLGSDSEGDSEGKSKGDSDAKEDSDANEDSDAKGDSDKSDSDAGSDGDSGNGASGLGTGGNWSAGGGLSEAKTADDKLLTTDEIAEALPSLE
ncbi:hypothetical protein PTI98_011540 [Pleurotus ostreatus]|nr:hypothetical protein PTI98_011540 [Pleurotus ostreatus]